MSPFIGISTGVGGRRRRAAAGGGGGGAPSMVLGLGGSLANPGSAGVLIVLQGRNASAFPGAPTGFTELTAGSGGLFTGFNTACHYRVLDGSEADPIILPNTDAFVAFYDPSGTGFQEGYFYRTSSQVNAPDRSGLAEAEYSWFTAVINQNGTYTGPPAEITDWTVAGADDTHARAGAWIVETATGQTIGNWGLTVAKGGLVTAVIAR